MPRSPWLKVLPVYPTRPAFYQPIEEPRRPVKDRVDRAAKTPANARFARAVAEAVAGNGGWFQLEGMGSSTARALRPVAELLCQCQIRLYRVADGGEWWCSVEVRPGFANATMAYFTQVISEGLNARA